MKKTSYGSIKDDFDVSYENTQADEIISQTYFRCSFIIEPVVFFLNFALGFIDISFSQFIYIRILNRLIGDSSIIPPNDINNSTLYSFDKVLFLPATTTIPLWTTTSPSTNNDQLCDSNSSFVNNRSVFLTDQSPSDPDQIRNEAQKQTAHFLFIFSLFVGIPSIFTTNLLGVNSAKLGRKFLLIIGLLELTLSSAAYLTLAIYPTLPDFIFYICGLIDGLCGSIYTFYLVLYCYITDLTTDNERSYRITLIDYISDITSLFVSLICGYIIKYFGFSYVFASNLLFFCLSLLYLIIFVPEPLIDIRSKSIFKRFKSFSLKRSKNSFSILFRKSHPTMKSCNEATSSETDRLLSNIEEENARVVQRQQSVILLVIIANLIYCCGFAGVNSIFILYVMNTPFCWDSVQISTFTFASSLFSILSSLLVSRFLQINDILICMLSISANIFSLFIYAHSKHTYQIFLAALVYSIGGLEFSFVKSLVTKLVTKHEATNAITLISYLENVTTVLGQIIFTFVYAKLIDTQVKMIFYIVAVIMAVSLVLHITAFLMYNNVKTDENDNQNEDI